MKERNQLTQLIPVNKTEPGVNGRKFIPMPSDAMHYIHHDKMSADKLYLYALLIDYYNVDEGAAWPSQERLAVDYGKTSKTVGNHLKDLEAVGLLAIPIKGKYIPLEPLTAEKFYERFPKAWTNYKQALEVSEKRRENDHIRWAAYRDSLRGTRN